MKTNQTAKCRLCISLGASHVATLFMQVKQAIQWADLIEIRLDKLSDFSLDTLSLIKKNANCPIIWTLRKASHGGEFHGSEDERFQILRTLLTHLQPAFMDLEADMPKEIIDDLQKLSPQTQWIISWHDLKETPVNLDLLFQKLARLPATYYKIATFAQSTTDAIRMLKFSRKINQSQSRLCALCMGELGQATRILSPLVGQPFTFAALEEGKETAPGQLTAEDLISTYRFREIDRSTELLGLIGRPVDKSYSNITHNAVFKELSYNAVYMKFHLEDEELYSFLNEIQALPIRGLSVTMPFKEKVLSVVQDNRDLAACNTLVKTSRGWQGYNTDGIGALKALGIPSLKHQKIAILGAGGTAKAIALAAHQEGAELAILNRTEERAKNIALPLNAKWGSLDLLPSLTQDGYHYIIQATSVGMAPKFDETPIPAEWVAKNAIVLDVISNPPETLLLKEVKNQGGKAISGRELFIHQAVQQFVCWLGPHISQSKVEHTIRNYLPKWKNGQSFRVKKCRLVGKFSLPPSKSHTIRAILLAAFAKGTSYLHHLLNSPDTACAIQAARHFGAKVEPTPTGLKIEGVAGKPNIPSDVIDAGNSGQVLRFAGALAALADGYTLFTGDQSIRSNRPIQPLLDGLKGLHAWAVSTRENGYAPFIVKGPLKAGIAHLDGQDSQPVSALLLAAAFVEGESEIHVCNAGEKPWLALTLSWLDRLGVKYHHQNLESFKVQGKLIRPAFEVTIPGDLSSLAFPLAAALVTKSEILIEGVDLNDVQGDKALVAVLQQMGACLEIDEAHCQLKVLVEGRLKGQIIDVNDFIDAVPILAVLGCYAEGETHIVNASIARKKESNRLECITAELKKMGACIEETEDGLRIRQSQLKGTYVHSHADHRLAMSLTVAGLGAEGETEVQEIECINKSYPTFLEDLKRIMQ
jgi:3-phosphoshikimate 1-carboxyvinyltransferase